MIPEAPTNERCTKFFYYLLETYVDENSKYPPTMWVSNLAVQLNAITMARSPFTVTSMISFILRTHVNMYSLMC
jgi:hypothetical protein